MKRLLGSLLLVIASLLIACQVLALWRGFTLSEINPSRERLSRAIRIDPSNPAPYYRLGLFYHWDLRNMNMEEAIRWFSMAIERNPLEQQYWIHLAKTLHRAGDPTASEKALEKAIRVFPAGYQGRWVSGNLLLQWGALEKAFPHFIYILSHYPNQSGLVYEVLGRAFKDTDLLLKEIVPKDPLSFRQFLSFLYETGDSRPVRQAWKIRASYGFNDTREDALRHIEFLIARGEINEAFRAWKERIHREGRPVPQDGNLVTNGGFEKRGVLGGGFDWRIENVSGAEISFDPSMGFEGKTSLRINFDGKQNIDFQHVYQYVAWQPGTDYILRGRIKTRGVTTKSGIKIEVLGVGAALYGASESLIGENDWKDLGFSFRTPAASQGGIVRLRREKTDKFDRFISGSVWIDNISLKERSH